MQKQIVAVSNIVEAIEGRIIHMKSSVRQTVEERSELGKSLRKHTVKRAKKTIAKATC
jgi:hypothetical protein